MRPYDDRLDYRRTWLELYLTLRDAVEFAFQYDFADPDRPINDAVVAYRGFKPFVLTVGNFKEPFSLNQLISDNNTLFTERSIADVFAPGRSFGISLSANGEAWTAAAGVFGGNANRGIEDNGVAGTARVTYAPILQTDEVLHFGLAGSYRLLDRDGQGFSLSVRPESFLFRTALVSTSRIRSADAVERVGAEAAYQIGALRFQGEYIWTGVERSAGLAGTGFHGGYVEAGWTVNGNGRPYELAPKYGTTYGIFGAPKIDSSQRLLNGGIGIFELGARVSYVDLTDRNISGGRELNYTLGVNWYPENNVKVAADYVRAMAYDSPAASRRVDADIFIGRVQVTW
jgi:phosphate-selective porin OprO/OprP